MKTNKYSPNKTIKNNSALKLATLLCVVSVISSYSQEHSDSGATISRDQASGGYVQFGAGPALQQDLRLQGIDAKVSFKTGARFDLAGGWSKDAWAIEIQTGVI